MIKAETIAAIATAPGRGGIGVVRVSGAKALIIGQAITKHELPARIASFGSFFDSNDLPMDAGIALTFKAPHSYTGEDVLELQAHGGQAVLALILNRCIELGARFARPGEFTERAFLNGKLDLAQAEAVADLIDATSAQAARSAARSLMGDFSKEVQALQAKLIELRMHTEACIDFPEEEIDPADRAWQREKTNELFVLCRNLQSRATQGSILRDGLTVALIGAPNVGKSSLLNCLAGEELAIVTPIAGTTRDSVRTSIHIQGVPIHLIDTAGIRATDDVVEKIGIERSWKAVSEARVVLIIDAPDEASDMRSALLADLEQRLPAGAIRCVVHNKVDLIDRGSLSGLDNGLHNEFAMGVSAKTGQGIDALRAWLLQQAGFEPGNEGVFMARARHLVALQSVSDRLDDAAQQFKAAVPAMELIAEDLKLAQNALGQITGEFTPDDLLGEIFSRFCIGK